MSDTPKRSRGRPKGGRAFESSDVVEAALEAIAVGGYAGLTMRGVARSIDASLATVQRHFATKDELWRGAIDAFLDGFERLDVSASDDPPMQRAIEDLLGRGVEHPGLVIALFSDQAPGHEERFAYIADRLAARQTRALETIAHLQEEGTIRGVDVPALLLLLHVGIAAIAGVSTAMRDIYGFDLDDPADRLRLASALADILRLGLATR